MPKSKSMGPERVTGRARPTRTRCATPARADAAAAHTACYRNAFDAQTALQRRHIRKRVARKPAKGPLSNRRLSRMPAIHHVSAEECWLVLSRVRLRALSPLRKGCGAGPPLRCG